MASNILVNDLVKDNESCLNRVMEAINLIDPQDYGNLQLSISPRKSHDTSVIVVTSAISMNARNCWELSGLACRTDVIFCVF